MAIKKLRLILVTVAALLFIPAAAYAEPPMGCPGGDTGPVAPGTICEDGTVPVKDNTLPLFCPGGEQQGAVPASYEVECPSRPGRTTCTYTEESKKCIDVNGANVTNGNGTSNATTSQLKSGDSDKIYNRLAGLINFLSAMVGVAVVISIIVGGIQYTTSSGDPQKVSAAKKRILNAVVALLAFIFMYAFLQFLIPGGIF